MVEHPQLRITAATGWSGRVGFFLSAALGAALLVAVVALALGLALVLIPVVAVGILIGAWRLRAFRATILRTTQDARRKNPESPQTIEADYTVIEKGR